MNQRYSGERKYVQCSSHSPSQIRQPGKVLPDQLKLLNHLWSRNYLLMKVGGTQQNLLGGDCLTTQPWHKHKNLKRQNRMTINIKKYSTLIKKCNVNVFLTYQVHKTFFKKQLRYSERGILFFKKLFMIKSISDVPPPPPINLLHLKQCRSVHWYKLSSDISQYFFKTHNLNHLIIKFGLRIYSEER